MKYTISFLFLISWLFYASGCKEDDGLPQAELEKLPSMTQTGENTFGCLVNGEAWVTRTTINARAIYQGGFLQISAGIEERKRDQGIFMSIDNSILENTGYAITKIVGEEASAYFIDTTIKDCFYDYEDVLDGQIFISKFSFKPYIVSGTFEYTTVSADGCGDTIRVTDGRFDLNFIP